MKAIRSFIILNTLIYISLLFPAEAQQKAAQSGTFAVYFSPRGGATSAIIQCLDNAKVLVLVQAYSFTSIPITEALVGAHNRGVIVQVLLDKSQRTQRFTAASLLCQAGIRTQIDAAHAIAHNKVMVIDSEIVITVSFNFTKAAEERNAENLLFISNVDLANRYTENWKAHQAHSEPSR